MPARSSYAQMRLALHQAIDRLPQRNFIRDDDAERWIESVIAQDPGRATWHLQRLQGIGGSESGVLVGQKHGYFHASKSPQTITAGKLLRVPIEIPDGDAARNIDMEATARQKYAQQLADRGAITRPDVVQQLAQFQDPNHPWLRGSPEDVVEENGKLYIVQYTAPLPGQDLAEKGDEVSFFQEAQLHHYGLLADRAGVAIAGLRMVVLDLARWNTFEFPVVLDRTLTQDLLDAGDLYWNQYVMRGEIAPATVMHNAQSLDQIAFVSEAQVPSEWGHSDDPTGSLAFSGPPQPVDAEALRQRVEQWVAEHSAYSLMSMVGQERSHRLSELARHALPVDIFPLDVDQIDAGVGKVYIDRVYDPEALVDAVRQLAARNPDGTDIEVTLAGPNFRTPAHYVADRLIELVEQHLGVDITKDDRFEAAISIPEGRNIKSLVAMLLDMDKEKTIHPSTLIDKSQSAVRLQLTREPIMGPLPTLREHYKTTIAHEVAPLMRQVAEAYPADRAQTQAQLEDINTRRPTRRRKM